MIFRGISEVFLIRTTDRGIGLRSLFKRFELSDFSGKRVALKANFNSANPFPASTHLDTLETLVSTLKEVGISELTLAERSGMGDTRRVLEQMGVFSLSEKLGFKVVVLDEEKKERWLKINGDGTHCTTDRGLKYLEMFEGFQQNMKSMSLT